MAERWLPIPAWPGYEASSLGRVRSVPRVLSDGRQHGGGLLAPAVSEDGYLVVTLSRGGRQRTVRVSVLVALTFIGPKPRRKPEVRHLDGNRQNNRPWNLKWGTRRQNEQDKRYTEGWKGQKGQKEGNRTGGQRGKQEGKTEQDRTDVLNRTGSCSPARDWDTAT